MRYWAVKHFKYISAIYTLPSVPLTYYILEENKLQRCPFKGTAPVTSMLYP